VRSPALISFIPKTRLPTVPNPITIKIVIFIANVVRPS
jgi:hypothetical protein